MKINFDSEIPIFLQIAEGIENNILLGIFAEEEQIPSITEFSVAYKINPATALKGINLLEDEKVIYKKRGIGAFVSEGAKEKLKKKRKESFYPNYVLKLVDEAIKISIEKDEVIEMIIKGFDERGNNNE